ncbi:hypothetical protein ACTMS0_26735 [Micromonospora sp. H33]|uniref:hypothetical protein n=1 Tax=Micromonospora sp. H33 TaxID=3452215 RepID=UPI003F88FD25
MIGLVRLCLSAATCYGRWEGSGWWLLAGRGRRGDVLLGVGGADPGGELDEADAGELALAEDVHGVSADEDVFRLQAAKGFVDLVVRARLAWPRLTTRVCAST